MGWLSHCILATGLGVKGAETILCGMCIIKLSKCITESSGHAVAPLAIVTKIPQCNGVLALWTTVWWHDVFPNAKGWVSLCLQ